MPNKTNNIYTTEQVEAVKSWNDLKELVDLDEVKSALTQRETQRLAHKRYQIKKSIVLEKAQDRYKNDADFRAEVDAEIAKL